MKTLCSLLALFCATSCGTLYVPSARNVPLFEKKGEFQTTASLGNALNLQAAYTPFKNFALSGNLLYANNRLPDRLTYRKVQSYEAAAGYYASGKHLFEVFVGYGRGFSKGQRHNPGIIFLIPGFDEHFDANYEKFFIQPTFAFRVRKKIQIGFTARVSYLDFHEINYTRNDSPRDIKRAKGYFFEPCATFKVYPITMTRKFFAFGQAGINSDSFKMSAYYGPLHFTVGVGLRLPGNVPDN
jgi:hypothetical protein